MRYAIIGTGYSFRAHTCTLKLIPGAELAAVSGRDADRLAAAVEFAGGGVRAYGDWRELLAGEDVDLVIVSTPNNTHAAIACEALAAGANVLCEKPMATTVEDCDRIIEQAAASEGALYVGLECRYNRFYMELARVIESGRLGRVHYIWCKEYRGFFQPGSDGWRTRQESTGGALLEKNVHHFDLFNWYAGSRPRTVAGVGGNAFNQESGVNDESMVILEYENGAKVNLNVCLYAPWMSHSGSHQEFGFVGDKGMLEAFLDTRRLVVTDTATAQCTESTVALPDVVESYKSVPGYRPDYDSWFYLLYEEHLSILRRFRDPGEFVIDGEMGKESVKAALAAEQAIRERRVVELG